MAATLSVPQVYSPYRKISTGSYDNFMKEIDELQERNEKMLEKNYKNEKRREVF